eukprot:366322-Chlamydomonas_euryale.AAC.12
MRKGERHKVRRGRTTARRGAPPPRGRPRNKVWQSAPACDRPIAKGCENKACVPTYTSRERVVRSARRCCQDVARQRQQYCTSGLSLGLLRDARFSADWAGMTWGSTGSRSRVSLCREAPAVRWPP